MISSGSPFNCSSTRSIRSSEGRVHGKPGFGFHRGAALRQHFGSDTACPRDCSRRAGVASFWRAAPRQLLSRGHPCSCLRQRLFPPVQPLPRRRAGACGYPQSPASPRVPQHRSGPRLLIPPNSLPAGWGPHLADGSVADENRAVFDDSWLAKRRPATRSTAPSQGKQLASSSYEETTTHTVYLSRFRRPSPQATRLAGRGSTQKGTGLAMDYTPCARPLP
jgi:hypothetical protein